VRFEQLQGPEKAIIKQTNSSKIRQSRQIPQSNGEAKVSATILVGVDNSDPSGVKWVKSIIYLSIGRQIILMCLKILYQFL